MTKQSGSRDGSGDVAHQVLDRLTAMKLRVGSLRQQLRVRTVAPEEMETRLAAIEQEIDAAAVMTQDVQAIEQEIDVTVLTAQDVQTSGGRASTA